MLIGHDGAANADFKNAIFVNMSAQLSFQLGTNQATWTWDNCDYWRPGAGNFATVSGSANVATAAAWVTGYDPTGKSIDPQLTVDYKLPPASPLIAAGTNYGTPCYLGYFGPMYRGGPVSVGVEEPQWPVVELLPEV